MRIKKVLIVMIALLAMLTVACGRRKAMKDFMIEGIDAFEAPAEGSITIEPFKAGFYANGAMSEYVTPEWSIVGEPGGISIDANGVITVTDKFIAGDVNGVDIMVQAHYSEFLKRKTVHVSPAKEDEVLSTEDDDSLKIYKIHRDVNEDEYIYVNRNTTGLTELSVGVSKMLLADTLTFYQVSVLHADGTVETYDQKSENGMVNITLDGTSSAVEVSPIMWLTFGYDKGNTPEGYLLINANTEYTEDALYGFYGMAANRTGSMVFTGDEKNDSGFAFVMPEGTYNIRLYKREKDPGRTTIKINGGSLGTNVGNPGTGGRSGITPYTFYMQEAYIDNGVFYISLGEKDREMCKLEIRRATTLKERRVHIFIGGDSTASNYYPIEIEEPERGRYQTGWGQVFSQYVTDDTVVANIAGGGTYAKSWYELAFPGVIRHGKEGDIFLIEEGINDRTYSNQPEMIQYLTYMIDECRAKGIIPVLVTAMQTPKFWKDAEGNVLGEFDAPIGSGMYGYAESIRKLAKDKNVFIIDVLSITSPLYGELGRTYVAQNFHLYNKKDNAEEDTLHLSYHGALNTAGIIATELYYLQRDGVKDAEGKAVTGVTFNDMTTVSYEHLNAEGETVTTTYPMLEAVYEHYAQ